MEFKRYIILRLLMVVIPLLTALASAMAQDTVYTGQATNLEVLETPGDTYIWELYNDVTGINFVSDLGNCPLGEAYFTGSSSGSTVNVMWLLQGTYFYKVTARRGGCTMNLKVGKMTVLWEIPTATLEPPPPICPGDSVHLTVHLTGTAPWNITVTEGVNSFTYINILTSPYNLTFPVIPIVVSSYWVSMVTDAHGTNNVPSPAVIQIFKPRPVNSPIYQYKP